MQESAMRFFFDLDDQIDDTGTDLPDSGSVPREALGLLLAVAADAPEPARAIRIAVRDQKRRSVYAATLKLDGAWTDEAA